MQKVPLFQSTKERALFALALILIASLNLAYRYTLYKDITSKKFYHTEAKVLNQYKKGRKWVLKLKSENFTFYTSTKEDLKDLRDRTVDVMLIKSRYGPTFLKFLKGGYFVSYIKKVHPKDMRMRVKEYISSQHQSTVAKEIFPALFLATPISYDIRQNLSALSLSHLVAISGYHLGILAAFVSALFLFLLKPIFQCFFPYLHMGRIVAILTVLAAFSYLLFIGDTPSLIRAFVLLAIGAFLYDRHIDILSFELLFWVALLILALYPQYLFSIGFWLSVAGVFFIYLFLRHFTLSGWKGVILLNFWLYLVMLPLVHFVFEDFSYLQLLSPFISMAFVLFYPVAALLHLFGLGGMLDFSVEWIDGDFTLFKLKTPLWFMGLYVALAFLSIYKHRVLYLFILINLLFLVYYIAKFQAV